MDVHSPVNTVHDNLISNLESTFSESLHIEDAFEGDDDCVVMEGNFSGFKQQETKLNMKCLKKSATFPLADTILPSSSCDEEVDTSLTESLSEQPAHLTYARSLSLPVPQKLVSAMKGSRERRGGSPVKLTVKWAPDVYDPVPTLLSHTVRSKKQQKPKKKKFDKKNGKKGQKGNSSRGGSGKDKKQFRKLGGTSDLCCKSLDCHDNVIEASTDLDALDVGSQDSYCGTSFLKNSVMKVHYSVAEAL